MGIDAQSFFSYLTSYVYLLLDTSKNNHGESFIEFLHDTQMCILNGRISKEDNDYYTFLSTRGKSVVDYIVVPYASLPSCNHFKIYQTNDSIEQFCLSNLLSKTCKAPYHEILSLQFIVNKDFTDPKLIFKTKAPAFEVESIPRRIYSFEDVPSIFLNSEVFGNRIDYLLRNMTCNNFNSIYSEFCQAVINDMDIHLKHFDLKDSGSFNKCKSNRKPFWDADLTECWHQMKNKEKLFRQHKGPWQERNELRKSFLNVRKTFDRCLARKEKQFNRPKVLIIDSY